MLIGGFGHDVLLSNLKTVELPTAPHGLTVEAVWGPSVLLGVEGEQMIGVATFGGVLHLVYTSFSPVAGLLGQGARADRRGLCRRVGCGIPSFVRIDASLQALGVRRYPRSENPDLGHPCLSGFAGPVSQAGGGFLGDVVDYGFQVPPGILQKL